MTVVMTDIMESRDNETYEEPEDEVQEVRLRARFHLDASESTASSVSICLSIYHFQ